MRRRHPELFKAGSEILNELLDLVGTATEATPGVNLLYKYGARAGHRLKEWWDRRGKRVLQGLDELKAHELLEKLPTYLGADLYDALAAERPPRLAILIDTYEALWRDRPLKAGAEALRADAWVRLLVQDTPGVLVALFGRDRLRWGEIDPAWDRAMEQHLLGGLSEADADLFLRRVPIEDAAVRARIVGAAEGLPFYLDLAADTYERIVNQGGTPAVGEFGVSRPEIVARFLDHLERGEVQGLKLAAHARVLDEPLLLYLCERFLGGAAAADFGRLGAYSFMTQQANGRLVMPALMRDELQRRDRAERPELFQRVHGVLFEWNDARCRPESPRDVGPEHEASLRDAAHHLRHFDPGRVGPWLLERGEVFQRAARYVLLEPLLAEAVADSEGDPAGEIRASLLDRLAAALKAQGRYGEAGPLFQRALAIREKVLPPDHLDAAESLNSLALLYQDQGHYGEAEPLFRRALAIREKALPPEHPDTAESLNNLAELYRAQRRYGAAEPLYRRAVAIFEAALGPEHPSVATAVNNLAELHRDQGNYSAAEPLYRRALAIGERALGPEHPYVGWFLASRADLFKATSRYHQAKADLERALAILEAKFGPEHPWTAEVRAVLAALGVDPAG